ncbi:MAG: hypothetical protein CVV52_07145 [Spirochaetae bacterium HGW-Spirochaetae-8]|jgi:predicted small lipoprotein YifL|nr:MAG: hypothetical protein CVV52_07145 [Spirochaetae bacterium HGW-Spirochaetae-8]
MKIKKINKVLLSAVVLIVLVSLAGCNMVDGGLQFDDAASRTMKIATGETVVAVQSKAPKSFTATVNMYQDYEHVVTLDMGSSNHHKTIEETLYSYAYGPYGGTIESDWDLLNGKNVVMTNVTNYNMDPVTGAISGSNHSVINVVDETGATVLTLQANGVVDGSLLGAEINMNWVAKESAGAKVNARGKVAGTFVWAVFNYETMSPEYILPNGTFTLTGTYN